ncbi:ras GEF [Macrolepiota fuliginosa MF-IS2]|uniref:Ras GEF n=1 Tax=Macrolepiota fuliginosa MF-IS2 TaxID=1400762 RepID=A0A9P5XLN6_9AGAR|nr:ras GEF [Macrolepiota fuliginosa MF-IS2]
MANPLSLPQLPPLDLQNGSGNSGEHFADSLSSAFQAIRPTLHSPQSLSPPPALRKSISVDSFVTSPSFSIPRQQRDPQPPAPRGFVAGLTSAFRRDSATDLRSTRNRGASVSSVREQQHQTDPDVDRYPLPDREQRFRLSSLKGPDPSRHLVRGGELPLPARTTSIANEPSTPLSSTSTSSEHVSITQPHLHRRSVNVLSNSGRTRSVSIGAQSQHPTKRMAINTQFSNVHPPPLPVMNENVTLIVIGAPGCGKTQAIRKGLSGFHLSDALPSTVQRVVGTTSVPMYTYRLGTIARDKFPDCPLTVIEIDVSLTDGRIPRDHLWPEAVPSIDGVVICYNSGDRASFKSVEPLLHPDLEPQIEPEYASRHLQQYRAGLVEVTIQTDAGKDKLKRSFDWLLKAVFRHRKAIDTINLTDGSYFNPASPDVLVSPVPWDTSRTATPTGAQPHPLPLHPLPTPPLHHQPQTQTYHGHLPDKPTPLTAFPSTSSIQVQNGDESFEHHLARLRSAGEAVLNDDDDDMHRIHSGNEIGDDGPVDPVQEDSHQPPGKEKDKPKPAQFATLDTLLDKLLFISVSGDAADPSFISSFLLTYRRFCTPRSVLLAMQKKMRQLDEPSGDPMFSCFAQMRICHLLEVWIADYPNDFAVKGTAGALNALIRSILAKTHLLHYGSQLLPFLEVLPMLEDQDAIWALKPEVTDESDAESSIDDEDYVKLDDHKYSHQPPPMPVPGPPPPPRPAATNPPSISRERKPSLPLVKSLGLALNGSSDHSDYSSRQQLKELLRIANDVMAIDAAEIAEEITRVEFGYFLDITNRDWMHFVFLKQRKPNDPIVAFNTIANHIGDWVVSLILCHDKPQRRARQMEKMVDIAGRLRTLNNYSALRAFVAGINNATYPGDETMEMFRSRSPEQAKNLQSWEVLLQQLRAHRAYRLALRNSKGSCIPAMEVHIADMIKAQEANRDFKEDDPTRIHWAKFSMMGRFVSVTFQCQNQCRSSTDYHFPDRRNISELFIKRTVMSLEMQRARLKDPEVGDYGVLPHHGLPKQDAQTIRRLFFW